MSAKQGGSVRVTGVRYEDDGRVVGRVEWESVPHLRFSLELTDGRLTEYRVRSTTGEVLATDLRAAPVKTMEALVRREVHRETQVWGSVQRAGHSVVELKDGKIEIRPGNDDSWKQLKSELDNLVAAAAPVVAYRRPGRAGRGLTYYAQLARRYVDLVEQGHESPIAALAVELSAGGERIEPKTVSNQIYRCRHVYGLLGEAPAGRPGGELKKKALKLLGMED